MPTTIEDPDRKDYPMLSAAPAVLRIAAGVLVVLGVGGVVAGIRASTSLGAAVAAGVSALVLAVIPALGALFLADFVDLQFELRRRLARTERRASRAEHLSERTLRDQSELRRVHDPRHDPRNEAAEPTPATATDAAHAA